MRVQANGIEIEVDDQRPPGGEPLLLVQGLGMQLIAWPDELVQDLAARGFRVLRIDNRDAGLSSGFEHLGVPSLPRQLWRRFLHLPVHAPYRIADMADDALGVLDALGIGRAHVCGVSMGGMIAMHLAAAHPQRLASLTLMMTTSGARRLPQPSLRIQRALMSRPPAGSDVEVVVRHFERVLDAIGSPAFPPEPQRMRERLRASTERAWRPAGTARQILAIMGDDDRTPLLARIQAPTRVIHGEADPLVPVAAGRDLVARIAGAECDFIAGMGHDLPLQLLPRFAADIAESAARWRASASAA